MIVIGIDPGTATTGWAVIRKSEKNQPEVIAYDCITTNPKNTPAERLEMISDQLSVLVKKYKPKIMAVESLYFFKNLKTAMPVSQAKGVILLTAAKNKMPVYEFTPLQVKMAITGYGRAEKKQVQKMAQILLNLKEFPKKDDAADALGIALCCLLKNQSKLS